MLCRGPTLLGVALLVALAPPPVEAAFLSINGLDRGALAGRKVSVALVRVRTLGVKWQTAHALSGHLTLELEDLVFGPRPSKTALAAVPYTSGVGYNSAWPDLGQKPAGTYLVMAWRKDVPCGEGSAVHFGERFSLPLVVSGAADDRVSAVRAILATVNVADEAARTKRLARVFGESTNAYLVLFADAALVAVDAAHRHSAARYSRLFHLIHGAPGADEELGWPLMQELARFPPLRDAAAYDTWSRGSRGPALDGSWPAFPELRRLVQAKLRAFAASTRTEANLRRWAITALAATPSFVGVRGDRLDARAVALVNERLRDTASVELRREAVKALLTMAAATRTTDKAGARRLVGQVRAAQRRERDTEERQLIQQKIDELWERPTP